jgi:hypothetical protein
MTYRQFLSSIGPTRDDVAFGAAIFAGLCTIIMTITGITVIAGNEVNVLYEAGTFILFLMFLFSAVFFVGTFVFWFIARR